MIRRFALATSLLCILLSVLNDSSVAQTPATGLPSLGTFAGGPFDTVDLANLDVHFAIPVFSRPGRGIPLSYSLGYDSLIWTPGSSNGQPAWVPANNWGWRAVTEAATGYVTYNYYNSLTTCYYYIHEGNQEIKVPGSVTTTWSDFVYHDPNGGLHAYPFSDAVVVVYNLGGTGNNCPATSYTNLPATAAPDNSGYILTVTITSGSPVATVNARGGLTIQVPPIPQATGAGSITDANGNQISISSSGVITDTLGTALTVTGTPSSGTVTYTYTAPSGNSASVTVTYGNYNIQTCFETGINEYSSPTTVPLVDRISYPDGSFYNFAYEVTSGCGASGKTTGRLKQVQVLDGGQIYYSYTGTTCDNNENCMMADGSPSSMIRTYGGFNPWTYTRAVQSGQPITQTTTNIIDPAGNTIALNFSSIYVTQRNTYEGSSTLLKNQVYCYNGNFGSGCATGVVTAPTNNMWSQWSYDYLTGQGLYKTTAQNYDQYGNLIAEADYPYTTSGSPTPIRGLSMTPNTSLCSSKNICDHPSSIQINNGSGTQAALTNYPLYDANGNLKQVQRWVSGSNYLTSSYTYNSNGTLATATDPKNTTTTYTYNNSICNGAFPTTVSVPGDGGTTISYNYTYNCAGGVVTQVTDVGNNHWGGAAYNDPYFWRPEYTYDLSGVETYLTTMA